MGLLCYLVVRKNNLLSSDYVPNDKPTLATNEYIFELVKLF